MTYFNYNMKTNRFLSLAFLCGMLTAITALWSCSSSENNETDEDYPGYIAQFSIKGIAAEISQTNGQIQLVLPGITDFSHLVPEFRVTAGKLTIDGMDVVSGKTELNLNQPTTLVVQNGESTTRYNLTVQNTGLPVVEITTVSEVKSKDTWQEGASIIIRKSDGSVDYEGTMSIRGRGNSTWNYPKKPYALKLDSKSGILGMAKHKRWILLANWKDRTLLRNDAAFWLSKQTGLEYTVNGTFVELVMNGKLMGNYYLCEQIKIDKNRLNITEMDPKETDPQKISGGFLMELDTYFDEVNKFKSEVFHLPFQFKQPDEGELSPEAYHYMQDYVNGLEAILNDEERLNNHEYEELFDVDSSIDWFFVHELATNTEPYSTWPIVGPHSCYMYKDREGKLMSGPVWDFDYHGFCPQFAEQWQCKQALYYPALFRDEKYRQRVRERWDELKGKFEALPQYLDSKIREISLSESVNSKLWPIQNDENGDEYMSFTEAIERMKKAFQTKMQFMDRSL